jgi:hypothetical protein
MQGIPGLKPVIGEVAPDSYASRADLRALDEITSVDGEATPTRQAAILAMLEGVVESVKLHDGSPRQKTVRRRALVSARARSGAARADRARHPLHGLGFSFWYPPQPVVVGELTPDFPQRQWALRSATVSSRSRARRSTTT